MAIDRDLGRRSPPMRSPGTMDDRARDIAPDGVPFNFYNSGRMDPPRMPRVPMPMPMPNPFPDPRFKPPPGMGPFSPDSFLDKMPRRMRPALMPNIRAPREGMGPAGMTQQEMRRETGAFDMPMGKQGIMESVAVDPSDYRTILKLIDAGLDPNDYVQQASMAYDDDDYGPFIPPSVLEMDQFGIDYGPQDEYLFDKEKGFENRIFGMDPNYMNRGGIASLLE